MLIAKVRASYAISSIQLAEILNYPLGTIHGAASGRRSLPAKKIELLEKLVEAAKALVPRGYRFKLVIPNNVAQALRKELNRLASKRSKMALKLFQMESAFERIRGARENLQYRHDALVDAQVLARSKLGGAHEFLGLLNLID